MKKLVQIIFWINLITIVGTLSSCKTSKSVSTDYIRTDTIVKKEVEVIEKEVIKLVPDSASITALLECDENGKVLIKQILDLKSGKAVVPKIIVRNDTLILDCEVDSLLVFREHLKRTSMVDSVSITEQHQIEKRQLESKVTFWYHYSIILTVILILIILGLLLNKYLKSRGLKLL